jgi:hypothetical protein
MHGQNPVDAWVIRLGWVSAYRMATASIAELPSSIRSSLKDVSAHSGRLAEMTTKSSRIGNL